jgi:hypothetical protein
MSGFSLPALDAASEAAFAMAAQLTSYMMCGGTCELRVELHVVQDLSKKSTS